MKRLFILFLSGFLVFSMCGCGKNDGTQAEEAKVSEVECIEIINAWYGVKFVDVEPADGALVRSEKAVMVQFEYTNHLEQKSAPVGSFTFTYQQNGDEAAALTQFGFSDSAQFQLMHNRYEAISAGETISFGEFVIVKDNTPLTICVEDHTGEIQKMQVDLSSVVAPAGTEETAEKLQIGKAYVTEAAELTVQDVSFAKECNVPTGPVSTEVKQASEGNIFLVVTCDVKNTGPEPLSLRNAHLIKGMVRDGETQIYEGENTFWGEKDIAPSAVKKQYMIIEMPETVSTGTDALAAYFTIDHVMYQHVIR